MLQNSTQSQAGKNKKAKPTDEVLQLRLKGACRREAQQCTGAHREAHSRRIYGPVYAAAQDEAICCWHHLFWELDTLKRKPEKYSVGVLVMTKIVIGTHNIAMGTLLGTRDTEDTWKIKKHCTHMRTKS